MVDRRQAILCRSLPESLIDPAINRNILYFYDLNAKMNWRIDSKNTVFLSSYFGRDVFGIQNAFNFAWGNGTVTSRWNSILKEDLFANFTLVYSDYTYDLGTPADQEFTFNWNSRIQNYVTKAALIGTKAQASQSTLDPGSIRGTPSIQPLSADRSVPDGSALYH